MKTKLLTTVLFAFFMAMILNTVDAQEKRIKIVKKADGKEDVKVFTSPDELDEETLQLLKEQGIDLNNMSDVKHEKKYKIVIKDDEGEAKTIEWNGEGEMPEELEGHLKDLDIDEMGDGKMMFIRAEGAEAIGDEEIEMDVDVIKLIEGEAGAEGDVKKKIRIKVIDDNGEVKEMEWNGEGDIPDDMQGYLDMDGCDGENTFVHKIKVKEMGGDKGVQLGVMIEKTEDGIKIMDTVEGSGAAKAGLVEGDMIQYLNGAPVNDLGQLVELVNENEADDVVKLGIIRNGNAQEVDVKLSERKEVHVMVKKVECEVEKCSKECKEKCKKVCTKEELEKCKKVCTKEEYEACKKKLEENESAKANEDVEFVAPRNNLKLDGFSAYPNPTEGLVNIEFEAAKAPIIVQLLDLSGKTLFKDTVNNFEGRYKNQFDLNDQAPGQFFVTVIQNEKIYTQQLIVN